MRFGLQSINSHTCADPDDVILVAQAAEAAGLDSLWTGEHVVLPSGSMARPDLPSAIPILDTITALTWIAAHTTTITVGAGVLIVPLHHPVLLAKQLASVDVLSKGRLVVGAAAGYVAAEYAAMGVSFDDRGARLDEYMAAMNALWTMDLPTFHGEYVTFDEVDAYPRPVSKPTPPVVFGGTSQAAFRRAVTSGHGWYGVGTVQTIETSIGSLRAAERRHDRPESLGPVEVMVTPVDGCAPDTIRRYEDLGVDAIVAFPTEPGEPMHDPVPLERLLRKVELLAR